MFFCNSCTGLYHFPLDARLCEFLPGKPDQKKNCDYTIPNHADDYKEI